VINKNLYKLEKIKKYDKEKRDLAYVAGISSIGMAYKMSIAQIDIADALFVEKEALKMRESYNFYFDKLTPKMLMNISISAINMSKNLDKYKTGVIKYTI
jgi:hypothetical protein